LAHKLTRRRVFLDEIVRSRSAASPTNTTPRRNGARLRGSATTFLALPNGTLSRRLPTSAFPARKSTKPGKSATPKSALPSTAKTGEQMTEPTEKNDLIVYDNVDTAPIISFDMAPAHGIMGGQVQIELACRILNALSDGSVEIKFITSGRLRCSPVAALTLRNAIDAALKMLEQPQQAPAATVTLN
jgi:hypothetical protein